MFISSLISKIYGEQIIQNFILSAEANSFEFNLKCHLRGKYQFITFKQATRRVLKYGIRNTFDEIAHSNSHIV